MGRIRQKIGIFLGFLLLCGPIFPQSERNPNVPPAAGAEEALPHDHHDGLTISADPYIDTERAKKKFGKANPVPAGVLPVEVFFRNETDAPLHIDLSTVQLEVRPPGGQRQDVDSLPAEEVANLIVHPAGSRTPSTRRFPPIALPSASNDKKVAGMADILRPLSLDADVVPPMGTIQGFLYFDVNHQVSLVDYASLYVPDVTVAVSNKPMMFFEVTFGAKRPRE
jgi:hypothetical protein